MTQQQSVSCIAPVNIAVIKYWGKRDEALILPVNSSLSVTLSHEDLCTQTTVTLQKDTITRFVLNGQPQPLNKRFLTVLRMIRDLRRDLEATDATLPLLSEFGVLVETTNNFPTAAGLASSASGFAALAFSLVKAFGLTLDNSEISRLARIGSGSACRSLFGGFARWNMGQLSTGEDSFAVQVVPHNHWPNLRIIIFVASDSQKPVSSSQGMQKTVETSSLLKKRIEQVPKKLEKITEAIERRDFHSFAEITMQDSNQFHAVCMDTYPPIMYLSDVSRAVIALVTAYNELAPGQNRAAYTFDAGPNAVVFLEEENFAEFSSIVGHFFPGTIESPSLSNELRESLEKRLFIQPSGCIKRLIFTKPGDGPHLYSA